MPDIATNASGESRDSADCRERDPPLVDAPDRRASGAIAAPGVRVSVMRTTLAILAAVLAAGWGTAHLFPTRAVVRGFGEIGTENRRVITMEWIYEGTTLIFAGLVTAAITLIGDDASKTATVAYVGIAVLLLVMAVISLMTAGRNRFIAYRLCAPIFSASAVLLLVAAAT